MCNLRIRKIYNLLSKIANLSPQFNFLIKIEINFDNAYDLYGLYADMMLKTSK